LNMDMAQSILLIVEIKRLLQLSMSPIAQVWVEFRQVDSLLFLSVVQCSFPFEYLSSFKSIS
jgi:hypothetical protein